MIQEEGGKGKRLFDLRGNCGRGAFPQPGRRRGVGHRVRDPIPSECNVRALAVYPDNPHCILAGSDVGIFSSEDNGTT